MFMKYNGILRERGASLGDDDAIKKARDTSTANIAAEGTNTKSGDDDDGSNNHQAVPYATTIHLAASGLTKLSRVQAVQPLFRGLGGRRHIKLPHK
jgi:hypothetical protein